MRLHWFPIALLLAAEPSSAGRVVVWAEGGAAIARAPYAFTEGWKDGYGVAAGLGWRTGPWVEVGTGVSIERFGTDGSRFARTLLPGEDLSGTTVGGGDASVLFLSGEARLFLPLSSSRVSLWAVGAGGLRRQSWDNVTVERTDDGGTTFEEFPVDAENELAVAAGGGLGIRVGRELWLTAEGRWLTTFSDPPTRVLPFHIGFAYR